uniref:Uncharacterized protein n=1 Tax=Anguilla anguilla TaxID=7936 RepID=A0A0E9XRR7_ANGAN
MGGILKIYVLGTLLSVVVAIIALVDSVGGLMYCRGQDLSETENIGVTQKHSSGIRSRSTAAALPR